MAEYVVHFLQVSHGVGKATSGGGVDDMVIYVFSRSGPLRTT